ncbi:hypothetical protein [Paludibaculum fermentans]|uniref:Uncharacterized protein n=1 Tax=Paludibaculum fermentans TaxID=1473598 RepID=A0A7S7NM43_PALFE|nr:hypothetical protein [Paludibaculum fermentans]QOY86171.1 hypothetical protein IRI77_25620 [Paludibaculum fermentans]
MPITNAFSTDVKSRRSVAVKDTARPLSTKQRPHRCSSAERLADKLLQSPKFLTDLRIVMQRLEAGE